MVSTEEVQFLSRFEMGAEHTEVEAVYMLK
jgi:hypothetical protein